MELDEFSQSKCTQFPPLTLVAVPCQRPKSSRYSSSFSALSLYSLLIAILTSNSLLVLPVLVLPTNGIIQRVFRHDRLLSLGAGEMHPCRYLASWLHSTPLNEHMIIHLPVSTGIWAHLCWRYSQESCRGLSSRTCLLERVLTLLSKEAGVGLLAMGWEYALLSGYCQTGFHDASPKFHFIHFVF